MHATYVKPPALGHEEVRSGEKARRGDRGEDAFFFQSACEAVRHHSHTATDW